MSTKRKQYIKRTSDFQMEEAYKTLRTNIEFSGNDIKVITFTSCIPGEGKSTVSAKVASALVASGKKVIVVDADMRRSVLRATLNAQVKVGLSHYLCGLKPLEEIIAKSKFDGVDIIFAGPVPPNAAELLDSAMFRGLIEELRAVYDYVIIDTPPLGSVIDSAIISRVSDGMVLVIEANKVSKRMVKKVVDQIHKTNCRILGTVLNKVDQKGKGYYGKYNYQYLYEADGESELLVQK